MVAAVDAAAGVAVMAADAVATGVAAAAGADMVAVVDAVVIVVATAEIAETAGNHWPVIAKSSPSITLSIGATFSQRVAEVPSQK